MAAKGDYCPMEVVAHTIDFFDSLDWENDYEDTLGTLESFDLAIVTNAIGKSPHSVDTQWEAAIVCTEAIFNLIGHVDPKISGMGNLWCDQAVKELNRLWNDLKVKKPALPSDSYVWDMLVETHYDLLHYGSIDALEEFSKQAMNMMSAD